MYTVHGRPKSLLIVTVQLILVTTASRMSKMLTTWEGITTTSDGQWHEY